MDPGIAVFAINPKQLDRQLKRHHARRDIHMGVWLRSNMTEKRTMRRPLLKKTPTKPLEIATIALSKRKRGRPPGSKNRVAAEPRKTSAAVARAVASPKAPERAPKMSKAELEAQLAKLERTVARLREQNKDLKRLVREGGKSTTAPEPPAKPTRRTTSSAVPKARRPGSSRSARQDDPADAARDGHGDHDAAE